jgi:hypothetical protein
MVFLNRLIVNAPGSNNAKTVVGVVGIIGLCAMQFYQGEKIKNGHRAFDLDKPEDVQTSMDAVAKLRLENHSKKIIAAAAAAASEKK